MSDEQIAFIIGFFAWLICVFAPITYVALKLKPGDLEDDNDPRGWFYWGKELSDD